MKNGTQGSAKLAKLWAVIIELDALVKNCLIYTFLQTLGSLQIEIISYLKLPHSG